MTQNNICTHDTVCQACAERCCSKHSMFHHISRYQQHVQVLHNNNCCLQAACKHENALTIRNALQYLLTTCQTSILSCQNACATLRLTICSVTRQNICCRRVFKVQRVISRSIKQLHDCHNICTHDTVSQACAERCCSKHSMFHDI